MAEASTQSDRQLWILGDVRADAGLFYAPTLLLVGLVFVLPYDLVAGGLLAILVLSVIDSGHVYTTLWRTYFRREELARRATYLWLPPLLVVVVAAWFYLDLPFLFAAFAYFTYYHHVRQYHGMTRWYEKLNGAFTHSGRWVLALTILPFVLLHFRSGVDPSLGNETFYIYAPNEALLRVVAGLYIATILAWLLWEVRRARAVGFERNRFASIFFPAIIHGVCMSFGRDFAEVAFGPLMQHGFTYFLAMGHSIQRLEMARVRSLLPGLLLIAATAALLGLGETGYRTWLGEGIYVPGERSLLTALAVGVMLMPALSHYIVDAWLWRGSHPDSKAVYRAHA